MQYNLEVFSKKFLNIRNSMSLTREELAKSSYVSIETIRKIELGKCLPSHEILEELSLILKSDLNKLALDCRLSNYAEYNKVLTRMESKLDRDEYYTLEVEYKDFKNLLVTTENKYYKTLIQQLILLIESIILDKRDKKKRESLDVLIQALRISSPDFSIDTYENFLYNDMELRILMNMAMLLENLVSLESALKLMNFCILNIDFSNKIYPKLCHNISSTYSLLEDYSNSLIYADMGIKYCMENRNYNGLNLLYYNKGVAEYSLGYDIYIDSLNKSISFCDVLGQEKLKNIIIDKCKEFYNIHIK